MPETYQTLRADPEGVSRFFRGFAWRTSRMICAIYIMGQCKDRLSPVLFPHHFKQRDG